MASMSGGTALRCLGSVCPGATTLAPPPSLGISRLFELTVERTPEEEKLHRDVFLPSVDNMKLPEVTAPLPLLSGLALFLIVFFSLVFSVFAIVIGIILYNKWQEQSRKRFY